ncbi:uncharacterized protein LOC127283494 isoform X2 [Leptopilina boulardi]|uniref:uncharacterized protein LOC127283494 isoform X2 n=1 Tax=Leptopilina boulardi TaxID=63433 RepID=UPI0021F678A3|nr:uncharacterized protein LOC127283494 isoform X2 [Leptopilina boulardi]
MTAIDMDESFFEKILQTHEKNNKIKVLEVSQNLATAKGDNYLSNIYRVIVKYNKDNGKFKANEEISLIVKSKTDKFVFGEISTSHFFKNEIYVFEKLLPKIEKYIGCSIAPFHYLSNENEQYIIMEDLGREGYAMGNKLKGVSYEHCLKIIEKVAKFHAGSVALYEKEPNLLENFDSISNHQQLADDYFNFVKNSLINLSDNIEKMWKDKEYQIIASKLRNLIDQIKDKLIAAFKHDADEFCVLNHGDLWVNNVMLKNNKDGKPSDVDYQIVSYTSPAIDVQHFLAMCPEFELKGVKDEEFLEIYLTILTKTMKKIGCKTNAPTMEQLKSSIYKRRIYSILTGLIYTPGILTNKIDETTLDLNVFDVPAAVETVEKMSKLYLHKGYFD